MNVNGVVVRAHVHAPAQVIKRVLEQELVPMHMCTR
jgi:hypothetical protein